MFNVFIESVKRPFVSNIPTALSSKCDGRNRSCDCRSSVQLIVSEIRDCESMRLIVFVLLFFRQFSQKVHTALKTKHTKLVSCFETASQLTVSKVICCSCKESLHWQILVTKRRKHKKLIIILRSSSNLVRKKKKVCLRCKCCSIIWFSSRFFTSFV